MLLIIAVPEEGSSIPAIMRRVVVLPQPLGPKMLRTCPLSSVKDISFTAKKGSLTEPKNPFFSVSALNDLYKFRTSIILSLLLPF